MWKVNAKGVEVNITPKTLIINRKNEDKNNPEGGDKTSKRTFLNFLTLK
jgi:hypothetical protein